MRTQDFSELCIMHFASKESEISSRILGEALISISTVIDEINSTLLTGKDISIKVKAFEKGSFEVPFELIEVAMLGVLSAPSISSIPEILKILKEFVEIKIKLKGTRPKDVEKVGKGLKITSESGDVFNISNITGDLVVNNVEINEAFDKSIGKLSEDKSIKKYSILKSNREPLFKIEEKDFSCFSLSNSSPHEEIVQTKEKKNSVPCSLSIHKVVFDMTSKWGFIYKGNKISARITDQAFLNKAQTEDRFGKGDILKVLMEIYQEFDETVGVYINKKYVITEIIQHIHRPQQMQLL